MKLNFTTPILILAALLVGVGFLAARGYEPQDFAEANTINAQQAEDVRHAAEMHALAEQNTANAYTNIAARRQYWTLAGAAVALLLMTVAVMTAGGYSAFTVAYALRLSLPQLAEAKKRYKEIHNRPDFYELGDGRKVFETRGKKLLLLDQTGAVSVLEGQAVPANPELVQIVLAQIAAGVAVEQSKQHGKVEIIK